MKVFAHRVVVHLNREQDSEGRLAIFSRMRDEETYVEGDALEQVASTWVVAESVDATLEKVFAMFNRGSGLFVGDEVYPQRSLSTGDVVEVDGVRYACQSVGWAAVPVEETRSNREITGIADVMGVHL